MHILPSALLHRQHAVEAGGCPGSSCEETPAEAAGQGGEKQGGGPALLVDPGQAEGGEGEPPMFQLE
jgi:hypothetical protein